MKKVLFISAVFAFACFTQAQQKSNKNNQNDQLVKSNFERTSEQMQLTEAQKAEVLEIHKKYDQKKEAIRQTGTAADFKALEVEKQKEIRAVLDPNQVKILDRSQIQQEKDSKGRSYKKSIK